MRAVFPMYDTPFQFMTLQRSGILTVSDLTDKRVGIGPQGGTTGIYMPEFFKVLKVNPISRTGSWSELAAAMEAGTLDALAVGAGVPFPEFANLEKRNKVRYLPLAASQVVALRLALPELGASVVPAGSYPSLTRHYQTVGLYNFVVAHRTLPDDLVYSIAEAVFANHDEMSRSTMPPPIPFQQILRATPSCRSMMALRAGTTISRRPAWCTATNPRDVVISANGRRSEQHRRCHRKGNQGPIKSPIS